MEMDNGKNTAIGMLEKKYKRSRFLGTKLAIYCGLMDNRIA
jgi:hypothetical protein